MKTTHHILIVKYSGSCTSTISHRMNTQFNFLEEGAVIFCSNVTQTGGDVFFFSGTIVSVGWTHVSCSRDCFGYTRYTSGRKHSLLVRACTWDLLTRRKILNLFRPSKSESGGLRNGKHLKTRVCLCFRSLRLKSNWEWTPLRSISAPQWCNVDTAFQPLWTQAAVICGV